MNTIVEKITELIKEMLQGWVMSNLEGMFTDVNTKVGTIAGEVSQTPSAWNAGIFNMIKKHKEPETKVQQVTRETIIGDILDMDETTAPYFLEIGMHCLGCPASRGESLEEACAVHGVDCDELIAKLNAHLAARG